MRLSTDFAEQVELLASTTPREAIAKCLSHFMPRVPLARAAEVHSDTEAADINRLPEFIPTTKRRAVRRKSIRSRKYRVVRDWAYSNHRRGTWRHAMVCSAVLNTDEDAARAYLAENYPDFAHNGIDFAWCEKQGYINYDLTGE